MDNNDKPNPAIILSVERAAEHHALAADATTTQEKRAHAAIARALDKAALQMLDGNMPRHVSGDIWLVQSRTGSEVYQIDLDTQQCTCPNGRTCWHLAAVNVCAEVAEAEAEAQ